MAHPVQVFYQNISTLFRSNYGEKINILYKAFFNSKNSAKLKFETNLGWQIFRYNNNFGGFSVQYFGTMFFGGVDGRFSSENLPSHGEPI